MGDKDDFGAIVTFLCGEQAKYVTGLRATCRRWHVRRAAVARFGQAERDRLKTHVVLGMASAGSTSCRTCRRARAHDPEQLARRWIPSASTSASMSRSIGSVNAENSPSNTPSARPVVAQRHPGGIDVGGEAEKDLGNPDRRIDRVLGRCVARHR